MNAVGRGPEQDPVPVLTGPDGQPLARRWEQNPVLTAEDVPGPATLVFNAGVAEYRGRYVMLFRNDVGDAEQRKLERTVLGLAWSDDGLHWEVEPEPVEIIPPDGEILRCYDPRVTVLDDVCYVSFAVDTRHGIRGGIAITEDFRSYEVLSLSAPDNRNMVIFPERIRGRIARLERPFPIYGRGASEAFDMWYSESPDGRFWGNEHLVLGSEQVPFVNCKIGPAAPPVRTESGWLATFHAVYKHEYDLPSWHSGWRKEYRVGLVLLDLDEPWRVIGMARAPLMIPDPAYRYEVEGFRGYAIFPGGMLMRPDGAVWLYYGAADTVEAVAFGRLDEWVRACLDGSGDG